MHTQHFFYEETECPELAEIDSTDTPSARLIIDGKDIELPPELTKMVLMGAQALHRKHLINMEFYSRFVSFREAARLLDVSMITMVYILDNNDIERNGEKLLLKDVVRAYSTYEKEHHDKVNDVLADMVDDAQEMGIY